MIHKKESLTVPSDKMIVGIVIGLLYAFAFYSFLYLGREVFRVLSLTPYNDLLILSNREVFLSNLFFAFIAAIMGQSVCFTHWFDAPAKLFGSSLRRKPSVVNDQRNLNWYFISWFSKVALVAGLMFCLTLEGGFYVFSISSELVLAAVLIVTVLFLNMWNTLRQTFKKESPRWMLISFVSIVLVSMVFANINLVDTGRINEKFLKGNVYHSYGLEVPEVNPAATKHAHWFMTRRSLLEEAYVVIDQSGNQEGFPAIISGNKPMNIEEFTKKISSGSNRRLKLRLHVDKRIPMGFIGKLNQQLISHGIDQVGYAVIPIHREYDKRYYRDRTIAMALQRQVEGVQAALSIVEGYGIDKVFYVDIERKGNYRFNNNLIGKHELTALAEKAVRKNDKSYCFVLTISEETCFGEYIFAYTEIFEALYNIRNEFSLNVYGAPWPDLEPPLQAKVKERFPYLMITTSSAF